MASALVFNATPRDVRDVVVDGVIRIRDRELVGVDEARTLHEAEQAAADLFRRAGVESRLTAI